MREVIEIILVVAIIAITSANIALLERLESCSDKVEAVAYDLFQYQCADPDQHMAYLCTKKE